MALTAKRKAKSHPALEDKKLPRNTAVQEWTKEDMSDSRIEGQKLATSPVYRSARQFTTIETMVFLSLRS
jgi:hypothetical protein